MEGQGMNEAPMAEMAANLLAQAQQTPVVELAAVALAVLYLLLAVREKLACWYAAFLSTAIFLQVFWEVRLYMESGLQVFYLAMAVYGWWSWRQGSGGAKQLAISRWPLSYHLYALVIIAAATGLSGYLLQGTDQRLAYLDSFTTWASVVTTFMVARKVLENWFYWLVIDSLSIYLYLDRALYFTALLFAVYIIIICFGWHRWHQAYRLTQHPQRGLARN